MDPRSHRPLLFPYSPTAEEWAQLTPEERRSYYASIPQDPPPIDVMPPEGMAHSNAQRYALEALEQFFRKRGRHIFLASNLSVLYPGEDSFAPDLMAVLDVEKAPDVELPAWVVVEEGRKLDFALEIHVAGDRRKDAVENVERYARLGIPEYFFFDRPKRKLFGWRLPAPSATSYLPILPQGGRFHSQVLDLDLTLLDGRLRFYMGTTELPAAAELIARLDALVVRLEERLDEEARAHEEAEQAREQEQRRREEAERRITELTAELERLRSEKK